MGDRTGFFSENGQRYTVDMRVLPAYCIISGLSMLGSIRVEQQVLNSWLGGQYTGVINVLVEKGLIQQQKIGKKTELFLDESPDILERLKPDLRSCKWVTDLCGNIADILGKHAEATKRKKPCEFVLPDEITCDRLYPLSRILKEILSNSDLATPESVSICISYLTRSIADNIEYIWQHEIDIHGSLERCFSAPYFAAISAESKFDAYCLKIKVLLNALWNLRRKGSKPKADDIIGQIINCIRTAEILKPQEAYRLYLPIIEMVCYHGTGSINCDMESALRLCDTVTENFRGLSLPNVNKLKYQ